MLISLSAASLSLPIFCRRRSRRYTTRLDDTDMYTNHLDDDLLARAERYSRNLRLALRLFRPDGAADAVYDEMHPGKPRSPESQQRLEARIREAVERYAEKLDRGERPGAG